MKKGREERTEKGKKGEWKGDADDRRRRKYLVLDWSDIALLPVVDRLGGSAFPVWDIQCVIAARTRGGCFEPCHLLNNLFTRLGWRRKRPCVSREPRATRPTRGSEVVARLTMSPKWFIASSYVWIPREASRLWLEICFRFFSQIKRRAVSST